jgi:glycosyltransferase involved in cell wall biosynthesis
MNQIISENYCIFALQKKIKMKQPLKIVYCTPALYLAGGMERVMTLKANYFAEHFGYDITIVITDGKGREPFYTLSDKVKVVNFEINFEELWNQPFLKKVLLYLKKQRQYKKKLTNFLMEQRPDITISMLRREINFINSIKDGSRKIGEIHINRAHFRTFEEKDSNFVKNVFSKCWMYTLLGKLKKLDRFVVLTESDRAAWSELNNVEVISNPLSFAPTTFSPLTSNKIIVVGRYCHEKGYDHLLRAWAAIQNRCPDWRLDVFGDGDRSAYEALIDQWHVDRSRCALNPRAQNIQQEFERSAIAVCSSRFEGFGLVIIEAMACGLPVVSFDCPWGPRTIIRNGEDGLLVENGHVDQLAEAMLKLTADDSLRTTMGSKARVNVQRFRIEIVADRWKKLFEKVLSL